MARPENRLANERSPYLRQHAHNPVDWYPWGDEALEKARREDKPILLSIGYAACHWCHVMERESFENPDIAALMNELFVNIKVDREERPDLDQVYQLVVQVMGRSGGWPLTVFLTPEGKPYFAGTYFPPQDRFGMPAFPAVLQTLADAWRTQRSAVEEQAGEITSAIGRAAGTPNDRFRAPLSDDVLRSASEKLLARFDDENGGFGARPKFPNTMCLDLLLRQGTRGEKAALRAVELALDRMRAGGIWDHLGGGFHRYSTDERWLVPHFEKMLYDNALLLRLYTDAFRVFGKEQYASTVRDIAGYLFSEMRDSSGAFYSSQDADSDGEEGKFFVWTKDEVLAVVGSGTPFDVVCAHFGITDEGNFEESTATVLSEVEPGPQVAVRLGLSVDTATSMLAAAKAAMLRHRNLRVRPARDEKVLASWNGLVIGALAEAGRVLRESSFVEAAEAAWSAIETSLIRDHRVGRYLKDRVRASERPGFLDDQSYVGNAALDLYEVTGNPRYVVLAHDIAEAMVRHHWDPARSAFFFAPDDGERLVARTADAFDQAIPAASSMAALLCLRLGGLVDEELLATGTSALTAIAGAAAASPFGMAQAVLAIDRAARGSTDILLVGDANATAAFMDVVFDQFLPNRAIAHVDPENPVSVAQARVLSEGRLTQGSPPLAYVCHDRTCSLPVRDPKGLEGLLRAAK